MQFLIIWEGEPQERDPLVSAALARQPGSRRSSYSRSRSAFSCRSWCCCGVRASAAAPSWRWSALLILISHLADKWWLVLPVFDNPAAVLARRRGDRCARRADAAAVPGSRCATVRPVARRTAIVEGPTMAESPMRRSREQPEHRLRKIRLAGRQDRAGVPRDLYPAGRRALHPDVGVSATRCPISQPRF